MIACEFQWAAFAAAQELWSSLEMQVRAVSALFDGRWAQRRFDYVQPVRLQRHVPPRQQKQYVTPVAWTDWGPEDAPLVICVGGVANCAMRFAFLADALCEGHRVVCMDWLGRGRSGWLAHESEYGLETYVEQLRQMFACVGAQQAVLVGSSLGGSVAIEFAARWPNRVAGLVLNDVGPHIPRDRRRRRAEALSRFHVFRSPQELLRRAGAAQRHDGPLADDVRLFLSWQLTRWSEENGGRIYRHDPRAMLAYRQEARRAVDQWSSWASVSAPVLMLHGMESDALDAATIERMREVHPMTIAHVPGAGHAPSLCHSAQVQCVVQWLQSPCGMPAEFELR
jgi:pimeloyl-ACP methyl ester carboxylesterase